MFLTSCTSGVHCIRVYVSHTGLPTDVCPCPREEGEDPYSIENIPDNLSYELQTKDGIVYVYENAEALSQNRPRSLPYPDLETFAIDLSHVLAMIVDGPT